MDAGKNIDSARPIICAYHKQLGLRDVRQVVDHEADQVRASIFLPRRQS
jgi:hypothetical protein